MFFLGEEGLGGDQECCSPFLHTVQPDSLLPPLPRAEVNELSKAQLCSPQVCLSATLLVLLWLLETQHS